MLQNRHDDKFALISRYIIVFTAENYKIHIIYKCMCFAKLTFKKYNTIKNSIYIYSQEFR